MMTRGRFMLRDKLDLDRAFDALWVPCMDWVHFPRAGKVALFSAYAALDAEAKAAYDADVQRVFRETHGSEAIVYRYRDCEHIGGASVSDVRPAWLSSDKYGTFVIHPEDVLVHFAQAGMPLWQKSFGHEREIILRPEADPRRIA